MEAQVLERRDLRLRANGQGLIRISHRPAPVAICDQVVRIEGPPVSGPAVGGAVKRLLVV